MFFCLEIPVCLMIAVIGNPARDKRNEYKMKIRNGLRSLSQDIRNRRTTVEALMRGTLEKAKASKNVLVSINQDALDQARQVDRSIQAGQRVPALAGIPVTLKDLFDIEGQVTLAGSIVLRHSAAPAARDCEVASRLRAAGLLFAGRANMSEFAFSGMGINPHYGTPKCVWDRRAGRLPGGSSSGSAVSVAEGIVPVSIGSDTAGSCRAPAAFNGIVGVKPSYGRLSLAGVYPLSPTSDAPGPMGVDVDSCFLLDQLMSGSWDGQGAPPSIHHTDCASLKLVVPVSAVMEDLDHEVADDFDRVVDALGQAGAQVEFIEMPVISECVKMFLTRAVVGYEALRHHAGLLEKYGHEYDPFVYNRMTAFKGVTDEEQQSRYRDKARMKASFEQTMKGLGADAVICPTTPCIPPTLAAAQVAENQTKINLRNLRNTASANYFDGCSISLPCQGYGQAPTGLMVSSAHGRDARLYMIAEAIERVIDSSRN